MSLASQPIPSIPEETVRVTQAAFPHPTRLMHMRDQLGPIYDDATCTDLSPRRGQPAETPWRFALITVMQYADTLTDRQAADAVRSRIDWQYAWGWELTDPGFDYSVLSKCRSRLIEGAAEQLLLDAMRAQFQAKGLLTSGGRARTDSTHILAAVRTLNRLEGVGETLRAALNDVAVVAPEWWRRQVTDDWFARYGKRREASRFPQGEAQRSAFAEQLGADGLHLLHARYHDATPRWLREIPTVDILRQTWMHQYYPDAHGQLRWRQAKDLPPAGRRRDAPYDPEAHCAKKRSMTWTGYQVHLTDTCEAHALHVIPHVETTEAAVADGDMTAPIHQAWAAHQLLPDAHIVDAGYVDAELIVQSRHHCHIELLGPVRPDVSWQAQHEQAYDISPFTIDWQGKHATCPQGNHRASWTPSRDPWDNEGIRVKWLQKDCGSWPQRSKCTTAKTAPRHMTIRPEPQHTALQWARQPQTTPAWKARYDVRAGIAGTLSQGLRGFGLRQCRSIGLAKTRLQHRATAAAMNIDRLAAWLDGRPHATTRVSRCAALAS